MKIWYLINFKEIIVIVLYFGGGQILIYCILIVILKVINCYICDIFLDDDDIEFEGVVGVDVDGYQLGVGRK